MAADGGTKAVIAALLANTGIAILKFLAFLLTGFSSMLAESIHSVADAGNQGLLLLGGKKAKRAATPEHPFGYGRERYIYSFIVAIVLFSVGGLFALYEAYHKYHEIAEGHTSEGAWEWVPIVVLVGAIIMESFSFRTAIVESNKVRGKASWVEFVQRAKSPELPVILLEDAAALLGLFFALIGVGMALITGNPYWDVVGTTAIGLLLVAVAIVLALETKSLLLGESATPESQRRIREALETTAGIDRVIHMKTLHLGPEELLVAVKTGIDRDASAEQVAESINAAERAIRDAEPAAQVIYIEPDIYRENHTADARPEPPAPAAH